MYNINVHFSFIAANRIRIIMTIDDKIFSRNQNRNRGKQAQGYDNISLYKETRTLPGLNIIHNLFVNVLFNIRTSRRVLYT